VNFIGWRGGCNGMGNGSGLGDVLHWLGGRDGLGGLFLDTDRFRQFAKSVGGRRCNQRGGPGGLRGANLFCQRQQRIRHIMQLDRSFLCVPDGLLFDGSRRGIGRRRGGFENRLGSLHSLSLSRRGDLGNLSGRLKNLCYFRSCFGDHRLYNRGGFDDRLGNRSCFDNW
jgi:hypothetical protein